MIPLLTRASRSLLAFPSPLSSDVVCFLFFFFFVSVVLGFLFYVWFSFGCCSFVFSSYFRSCVCVFFVVVGTNLSSCFVSGCWSHILKNIFFVALCLSFALSLLSCALVPVAMERAFGCFEDCVYDAFVSACGAFDSASFAAILDSVLQRRQLFYSQGMQTLEVWTSLGGYFFLFLCQLTFLYVGVMQCVDGDLVTSVQVTQWRRLVRRVLFTSSRFQLAPRAHSTALEFFILNHSQVRWYYFYDHAFQQHVHVNNNTIQNSTAPLQQLLQAAQRTHDSLTAIERTESTAAHSLPSSLLHLPLLLSSPESHAFRHQDDDRLDVMSTGRHSSICKLDFMGCSLTQ